MKRRALVAPLGLLAFFLSADAALAQAGADHARRGISPVARPRYQPPNGAHLLRALGPHAARTFAPSSGLIGALVELPPSTPAEQLGLVPVAPGIGRLRGSLDTVLAFADAHPALRLEVAPPLHRLMDRATFWTGSRAARTTQGADGTGVYIGVADTGLDITHPELRGADGKTRIAWMLDYSLRPVSTQSALWPNKALEEKYAIKNDAGELTAGAVLSRSEIDAILANGQKGPTDEEGHGTHVTSIAAASGIKTQYAGIAPRADIVFVRITHAGSQSIDDTDVVHGVEFMFDRADADKKAAVVNLSLGSEFGPHDGKMLWEQAIASHVGPDKPGHAIVAAAGNSGSIEAPTHQSVHVSRGGKMRVPVRTSGAAIDGQVQIWVTLRPGADVKIGLESPDGEWIAPIAEGEQAGHNQDGYRSGVIYGAGAAPDSQVPQGSKSAIVVWSGVWPAGTYNVVLEGDGTAELYLEGVGEVGLGGAHPALFANGVREGTITLPATHPALIAVGCTVNRPSWLSIGRAELTLHQPLLDPTGTFLLDGSRELDEGEVCYFSSAGPTVTGVQKPEISAPGAAVIAAMSKDAIPGTPGSVFTDPSCPQPTNGSSDERCLQVDKTHAVSLGTSMSTPVVAGVVALLFQRDPTLNQDQVRALLQGGAHRFRGAAPFADQAGPGEVDAVGALAALDRMKSPDNVLPIAEHSWLATSADHVAADGSTPMTVLLELRNAKDGPSDFFDVKRLASVVIVDGVKQPPREIVRRGPGVFVYTYTPDAGLGGKAATLGATFDGVPIVQWKTFPIANDGWAAAYAPATRGGCAAAPASVYSAPVAPALALLALALLRRRRR